MHKSNRSGSTVAGVALITVLAVLTVLGLLAAAFTIFTTTDTMTSRTSVARVTADMMSAAGLNHALSALWADSVEQPAWDEPQENWRTTFVPVSHSADDAADIDGLPGLSPNESKEDGRWIYVGSANGKIIGRYAVLLDDECSKVNVNAAAAIGTHGQNMGVGPFELLMSDGRGRGLPLSTAYCVNALKYRYGNDLAPGKRGEDDNLTESTYGYDEIDNDADGIVDELGEGVDEQEEYSSVRPVWDDRVFASVDELLDKCDTGGRVTSVTGRRMLRRYATIYGRSRDMYFDERTGAWRRQVNLNVAVRDQVSRLMNRANAEARFESSSKNVALTVANIIDYRDQNHVLTTAASEYGVEAVCFNEVLSYDGSWIRETDWTGWGFPTDANGEGHVLCYNVYYGADKSENYGSGYTVQNRFRIKSVAGASVTLDEPASAPRRLKEFLKCEIQTGGWPKDLWKDGTAHIGVMADQRRETNGFDCTVEASDAGGGRRLSLKLTPAQQSMLSARARFTITLKNAWHHDGSMWTDKPRQSELYCFRMPNRYLGKKLHYQVINANHCFPADWGWARSKVRDMDMDGEGNRDSVTQESRSDDGTYRLQYLYKDGKAVQPNSDGYIPVLLTSSPRCHTVGTSSIGNQYNNYSDSMYFIRPDVVELINISGRAISLRNWHVVVNTGVEAVDLSTIDSARFSHPTLGRYDDPNPSIAANGYFYLTNNREIFGLDYGDGGGDYGSNRKEVNPVCEIPDQNWGIKYKITSVDHSDNITVEGADWRPDQLLGELVEYVSSRQPSNRDAPNGVIKNITSNTRKSINVAGQDPFGSGLIAGDFIRIKGLPRQGCFASFTLKNEYRQVTARTTEYGSLTEEQFGRSTEKYDPTHYNWVISSRPTISGDPKFSRNNSLPGGTTVPAHVKDNNFVSVGEVQQVRKPSDWENIGMKRGKASVNTLKAIARYFTVSGIRLDPEEQGAHISGWRAAFGKATTGSANKAFRSNCSWEPNIWAGQTLRLMSGVLNGEKYFITNSTQSGVTVAGYSTQSGKQLQVNPGDRFNVGPGYATPMFYCRQNGEAGVWEWPNKGIEPMSYGLYLSGLNDAIVTTEFLEENHNAELRVEVFNFQTEAFEQVPLARDNYSTSAAEDVYKMVRGRGLMQYDKNDNLYCGMIHAEHISANGGIRLRITPSSLNDKLGSGFAWFDYAVLTPGNTLGKININTASERVLASMPGITPVLAANIARGLDAVGRPTLKPFRNITDILDVRGMMPDVFSTIANLITTRSDQFRVQVVAQALDCSAPDGTYDEKRGDRVTAQTQNDIVVDRSQLTDDNPANNGFLFLPSK